MEKEKRGEWEEGGKKKKEDSVYMIDGKNIYVFGKFLPVGINFLQTRCEPVLVVPFVLLICVTLRKRITKLLDIK